ncbi:unnamed protein product [Rotaria sp. Silwood1]|nr:unnamed protein product [Rotaria sp. Silwood1]
MPRALVKVSNIDPTTRQITMRRSHPWINNFNEWLLTACRSNMGIKFIWSGNDAKALVYYMTDYVTKSTLAFYDMFALAQQGIKSIEHERISNSTDNIVDKSRKLVLRCFNMIASQQEVSGVQFDFDRTRCPGENNYGIIHDVHIFDVAREHHTTTIKEWKRDIEARRDETRNYLISGEDTLEVRDDETQIEVVGAEIPTSPIKTKATRVLLVTATNLVLFPTKQNIVKQFTLNTQQKYAFMIITSHLDGENHAYTDTIDNQLLMCIPGCGGTGKSQLIRAITKYFQVTKRDKMLRKLAPTSIAAAEIDGLTIHSFLGESRKNSKKKQTRHLKERRCRCLSNDLTCWPNASSWQRFNESIDGRLVSPKPSAAVCNYNLLNTDACVIATAQWTNASWRSDQVGAMQNHNWEKSSCSISSPNISCSQGSVPVLAVNATLSEHVQATVRMATVNNLRLVIKTTGHDYLGRSTAAGSLLLWLHFMTNMTLIPDFSSCTGENVLNAIRLDAGVQWGQVYTWLAQYNLTAIGGASGTVSATGGFLQGGGHGPLTRWKGLAVDQVLEFDVVTADGRRQTVNTCQNSNLFWTLRGGGGGTFAIVLSAVLRTFPSPSVLSSFNILTIANETRYNSFVHNFIHFLPTLADNGWAGSFYMADTSLVIIFLLPNGDLNVANATWNQLMKNNTDLNFMQPFILTFSSFNDFFLNVLAPFNPTGDNVLLGSRLIPETIVRNQPEQLAETFLRIKGKAGTSLIGHLVAGGQVSNMSNNNSVNSAWRTALLHMIYSQSWPDGTSDEEQQKLAAHVTSQVDILQTVSGGSQSGAYMNEANPNELNWQQKFFGTQQIYDRLKSIKQAVDPHGLFVCKNCVGSEDWSLDLNCPKMSSANKVSTTILLFVIMQFLC